MLCGAFLFLVPLFGPVGKFRKTASDVPLPFLTRQPRCIFPALKRGNLMTWFFPLPLPDKEYWIVQTFFILFLAVCVLPEM
jgi:hypothetical protein